MLPFPIISHLRMQVQVQIQKFQPYSGGFVLLDNQGNLYVKGNQTAGQFGVGNTSAVTTPTISATNVSNFWIADNVMIIAKKDGTYHASGGYLTQYGASTASSTIFTDLTIKLSPGLSVAQEVYICRGGAIVVRTSSNSVMTIGDNRYGFVGIAESTASFTWTTLAALSNVVEVQVGNNYCVAKKSDNSLWAWGYNNNYAFTPSIGDSRYTTPIRILTGVIDYKILNGIGLAYLNSTSLYIRGYCDGYFGLTGTPFIDPVSIFSVQQPFPFSTSIRFIRDDTNVWLSPSTTKAFLFDGTSKYYVCGLEYSKCFGINSPGTSAWVYNLTEVPISVPGITSMNFYGQQYTLFMKDGVLYGAGNVSAITGVSTDNAVPLFKPIQVQVN